MPSSGLSEVRRQSWRDLRSCIRQIFANEAERLAVLWDRLCTLASVVAACVGLLVICYGIVCFISSVCLNDIFSVQALSGEQCVGLASTWAIALITVCLMLYVHGAKRDDESGHHEALRREVWINYQDAVVALEDALVQLDVGGIQGPLAEQMLSPLLEGHEPDESTEIRYLDTMFAIADGLSGLNVKRYGFTDEEIAERVLAVQWYGSMAR